MRKIFGYLLAICLAAGAVLFIRDVLFPFVYRIKEPYFAVPVRLDKRICVIEDLPVRNDAYGEGEFGAKRRGGRAHKGLDLSAETGSPVYASKSGWVRSYFAPGGYGNLVVIDHPGGCQTRYGHLKEIFISKPRTWVSQVRGLRSSTWVRQGDTIGSVGKTGNAGVEGIEPHLHFEIRYGGKAVDPAKELIKNSALGR